MKTRVRDVGDVRVLDLEGKITIGAGDVELRKQIEDAVAGGKLHLLLNLAGVSHIDSSGIGEMVGCFTTLARKGGKMKLLTSPRRSTTSFRSPSSSRSSTFTTARRRRSPVSSSRPRFVPCSVARRNSRVGFDAGSRPEARRERSPVGCSLSRDREGRRLSAAGGAI